MSFHFSQSGKPANVKAALDRYVQSQTGPSKAEVEKVQPLLNSLIDLNVASSPDSIIKVMASGSTTTKDGVVTSSSCAVTIEPVHATC